MRKADMEQRLRESGCKVTPARLAVLQHLNRSKKPMSVAQLLRRLGPGFDQVTLYRTLQTLTDAGILKQVDLQQGAAYYEIASLGEHHHAVCVQCHTVEDVEVCSVGMEESALRQSGFASILRHSLEFFGLCRQCTKK